MNGYEYLMAQNYIGQFRQALSGYSSIRDTYYRRWYARWGPFGGVNGDEPCWLWEKRWEEFWNHPNLDFERIMYPFRDE